MAFSVKGKTAIVTGAGSGESKDPDIVDKTNTDIFN